MKAIVKNSQNNDCDAENKKDQENLEVVDSGEGDHDNKQEDVEEEESEDVKEIHRIRFMENLNK